MPGVAYRAGAFDLGSGVRGLPALAFCFPIGLDSILYTSRPNDTMDFSLNDHQKLIRDTVRQFMENEVCPSVRQRHRDRRLTTA